jgi:hypothetical protein
LAAEEEMSPGLRIVVAVFLLHASFSGASAQDSSPARALASNYQLADAVGERKCPVTLETRTAAPGFALTYDRAVCGLVFPFLAEVVAWQPAPAGGINFVNAKGAVITEFTEGVGGVYEAIRENDGVYFLSNLKIADVSDTQPADVIGDWNLSRPGGPAICRITLTNEAAGENRLAVRVAPNCDAAITTFGPATWQLSGGDVVLYSKDGDVIRLGKNEEGIWSRVPDQKQSRPRPLQMTRP